VSFLIEKYAFRPGCCSVKQADDTYVGIVGPCYECGTSQTVQVKIADLARFRNGGFAQDCFPHLPAAEREFLISGICGACWDKMFPDNEEDETE
jgi:hypothetical protein